MDAFAGEFLDRQARHWKPKTRETNVRIVRKDILPAFGHLTVDAVAVEQVRDWFASMSDRPGLANRAMPVLAMMMRMAERWGYRAHNSNPCRNTRRYRMKPMERFLTAEEMARLNAVLTRDEFWCPNVVAIVRLLMLTGCRFGEIAALEWDWIKGRRIFLPDSKSGPRTVWLSSAARAATDAIPRYSEDCPYLFPARPPTRPIDNIASQWNRIRDEAGLPGLRLHDLRHSWASTAAMNGVDMVTIAKLLGPTLVETTARYVHLSNRSVTDAADRVSNRIHAAPAGRGTEHEGECNPAEKDSILFDKALPGFGLRIHPSGRKVWIVQARIGPEGVDAWFDAASRDKPGAANRALEILRAMMFRAEEWGLCERGSNPCLGIAKNPRKQVARFLDADELARLGRALDAHEARWPEAVAAIRPLALTGCRRSEVLDLRWRDIGEDAMNLADSKTGPRAVPLGEAARALIEALPGPRDPDASLFPRHAKGRGIWILTSC